MNLKYRSKIINENGSNIVWESVGSGHISGP